MQVRDVTVQPVITASEDASLEEIAKIMVERRVGSVPIVDSQNHLCGLITMSDFAPRQPGAPRPAFRAVEHFRAWLAGGAAADLFAQRRGLPAREVMSSPVTTVGEDDSLDVALDRMHQQGLHRIVAVRDGVPVGVISQTDLLRLMFRRQR